MDKIDNLIHLLNDDNLDLLEYCRMCRACIGIMFDSAEFRCGFQNHILTKDVLFCKERENLKNRVHI